MIIHKQGRKKVIAYIGLGQYQPIPTPLCVGIKAYYHGARCYWTHRLWKNVTCKNCLKIRNKKD